MHVHRKVCPHPGIRAGKTALDHTPSASTAFVRASDLKPKQVVNATRQLFGVAKIGDVRSFKSLLRNSKTAAAKINFQYSAKVAEEGGDNLWPWYWCVDTRDTLPLCWGAPSGIEPERGDTLLIITLKIGLEKHAKHLLQHRGLDLRVRNFSGRDAAGVAAMYGREALSSRLQRCYSLQRQQPRRPRVLRHLPKASNTSRQRRRQQRLAQPGAQRDSKMGWYNDYSASSKVASSCTGACPHVGPSLSINTAKAGAFNHLKNNSLDIRRSGDREESFGAESKGAFGAAAAAGMVLGTQKNEREKTRDGPEAVVGQSEDGERKSSVRVDATALHLSSGACRVHPSPDETRAVAVQTDPELFGAPDTAALALAGQARQTTDTPGVAESTPSLGRFTDSSRLERRSTAPGDISPRSLGIGLPIRSMTGPRDAVVGKRSNAWQTNHERDLASNKPLQKAQVEEECAPASGNANDDLEGSSSAIASSTKFCEYRTERPYIVSVDRRSPLSSDTVYESRSTALQENGDITERQREMLDPRGVGGGLAAGECSSSGTAHPPLGRRSKVDEVTRELQRLLREDALQDDGSFDYRAAFELFDVDHDGNVTPDEMHSTCIRLGMGSILAEEEIAMVIERLPRDASGLITKTQLQLFAVRPADVPWPLRRSSSGHKLGEEVAAIAEAGVAISVVLKELQVNAAPPPGGVFSWKKASKDLSSASMFVRITRGLHVVESAAVLPRSVSMEDGSDGTGDGSRHMGDANEYKRRWSWRWDEALVLPGSVAATSGASPRSSPRSAGLDADDEQVAGLEEEQEAVGEDQQGHESPANPLVTAVHNNEGPRASTGNKDTKDNKETVFSGREALSTTTDVASGATATGDIQGDAKPPGNSNAYRFNTNAPSVAGTMNDSTGCNQDSTRILAGIDDKLAGGGASIAVATSPDSCVGVKKKRLVSFWSTRKGQRHNAAIIDTSILEEQSTNGRTGNGNGGEEALTAAAHVEVAAAAETPDDGSSSGDFNPSGVQMASIDSTSSDESYPEVSVKMGDIVAGEGDVVENDAPTEADSGVARKRGVSFWNPRKGRRKKPGNAIRAEQSSKIGSNRDSETSAVFNVDDQGEHDTGKEDDFVPDGESINDNDTPERLRKREGGALWSPTREGSGRRKKKASNADGSRKRDVAGVDGHASDRHGPAATTKGRLSAYTTRKSITYETFRRRRRRAPMEACTAPDVLFVEVWEVNRAAAFRPPPTERDAVVAEPECNGFEGGLRSTHSGDLDETSLADGVVDRSDSGEKSSPVPTPEHERHLVARFESGKESLPAKGGILHTSGATPGQGMDSVEAQLLSTELTVQKGCADDDHSEATSDEVSAVGDESSVASAFSNKNTRPRRPGVFLSPFKGRRMKHKGWSKLPAPESPLTPSELKTTQTSRLAVGEGDGDRSKAPVEQGGGQQGRGTLRGNGKNKVDEAALVSRAPHELERSVKCDEENDDSDDDASVLSQVSIASELSVISETPTKHTRNKVGSMFSPIKGKKLNNKSQPPFGWQRSDSKLLKKSQDNVGKMRPLVTRGKYGNDPKPILWGRLTIPVAGVLFPARGEGADGMHDECLADGVNVLSGGAGIENLADSERLTNRPLTGESLERSSSVFGMSLPRLGLKKREAEKGNEALDGISAGVRVIETAPASLPRPSPTSTVESWFEVGNPKGKKRTKVKGSMHLALSWCADENYSPEHIPY